MASHILKFSCFPLSGRVARTARARGNVAHKGRFRSLHSDTGSTQDVVKVALNHSCGNLSVAQPSTHPPPTVPPQAKRNKEKTGFPCET